MLPRCAAVIQQFLVGRNLRPGIDLFDHIGTERRRLQDLAQDLQAFDIGGAIGLGREIVDPYFRRRRGVGAPDAKRAAALGAQLTDRRRESGKRMQLFAHLVGRERQKVDLDIRRRQPRIGLEERPRRARGDRQRPLAERRISQAGHNLAERTVDDVVERDGFRAAHHHPDLHVILQIVADPGRIEHDIDAVLAQQFRRADAGELQQLRRVIRAARNQDFLARPRGSQRPGLAVFDRHRATSIEQDALRQRGSLDLQVVSALGGAKIRYRRARSSAVPRRGLEKPAPSCVAPLKSGFFGNAGFGGRCDEGRGERIGVAQIGNRQRAADAVEIVGAALLVLGLLEIRQHVVKTPAQVAVLAPAIVILVLAANVKQAVDRTRSAQHLAARLKHRCARPGPARARSGTSS